MKLPEALLSMLDQGLIHEVIRPLMSGKEAAVYLVSTRDGICVAKVYKDADHRSFRQRAAYTDGRQVRNSRQRRAMEKGSRYGKEQEEAAWQNAEVDNLYKLHAAGLRVPKPIQYADGVLLMELVMNPDGEPAPRLCDCTFTPEQAWRVLEFVVYQVAGMLGNGLIHGDLSEYNVLLAWDGPMIIDLPQAVNAAFSQNARAMLVRDVTNITQFLARSNPRLAEARFGEEMWALYERAQLFPDTRLTGVWRGSSRRVDTRGVLREIEDAARDARRRR